jgi:hypothetical protein
MLSGRVLQTENRILLRFRLSGGMLRQFYAAKRFKRTRCTLYVFEAKNWHGSGFANQAISQSGHTAGDVRPCCKPVYLNIFKSALDRVPGK